MDKIKTLGQVYTPDNIIKTMFRLSSNDGSILEPSSGDGAFVNYIKSISNREITAIEIDPNNKSTNCHIMDFFELPEENKYQTIIGNPPYVAYKNINSETLQKIKNKPYLTYDRRTNLYIFFIRKCIEHLSENGEIIFITPREFIKLTSSIKLNTLLYQKGSITHWYEYGDDKIFNGYTPTVAIWRWQKGNFNRETKTNTGLRNFNLTDGQISFTSGNNNIKFSDLFDVKVGAVSGMDKIFTNVNGNAEFVCSYTKRTGKLRKMFYNIEHDDLIKFKDKLLSRRIKKFNQNNWWQWGRGLYESDDDRIYVNCRTRDSKPFFTNAAKYYDGSILAIFPKHQIDINKTITMLNSVDWNELGFKVGGRLCFSQKALLNTNLPDIGWELPN